MKVDPGKIKLSILLLIIFVPILLATWAFRVLDGGEGFATRNNGVLIRPVLDITELALVDEAGAALFVTFEELVADISHEDYVPRPWAVFYLGMESCDSVCGDRLFYLRQLHRRLGADAARLERYYVNASEGRQPLDERSQAMFNEAFPEMKLAYALPAILRANLTRALPEGVDPVAEGYILVADPVGNVMMYFTPDNTPEEILSDINRLLSQSSLG